MANIGFIGLGHMGLPMAMNLIRAGHHVTGYDIQPAAMEMFASHGGQVAIDVRDMAQSADIMVTMLQTGSQVKEVALGDKGFLSILKKGAWFIDCSTIDVVSARELHQAACQQGVLSVDAPVSGGVAGAQAGTLTFMVGGEEADFHQVEPILLAMGKNIIHAGACGSGQAAKICNNMILGISMIAISEAFVLAEALGLTPQKLFSVVSHASGQCWAMTHYVPVPDVLDNVPANRAYAPGFTVAMMLKDLHLSQQSAQSAGVTLSMGEQATALYQQFSDAGQAGLDFSAIIQAIHHAQTSDPKRE